MIGPNRAPIGASGPALIPVRANPENAPRMAAASNRLQPKKKALLTHGERLVRIGRLWTLPTLFHGVRLAVYLFRGSA
jgi:hypothetical protein